ncbi:heavy-metal-associated domain-containing protein [Croceiramulus getboli]|nr:heavy-metal-associated domain-containing protein [Flavobacteriaceae bacterium YJPT1-3]
MKSITLLVSLLVMLTTGLTANAQNDRDAFEVQVDGLGCPFCAYGLEKKFKEFRGIRDVKIDIETGDFSFNYPTEKALSMAAVIKQVEKAGYTPITAKITRADGKVEEKSANNTQLSATSEVKTQQVFVAGNCEMCEARIVNAAEGLSGVTEAAWDKNTKLMKVTYDRSQTTMDDIQRTVAKAGHDTKAHQATDKKYADLPGCCKYERVNQ